MRPIAESGLYDADMENDMSNRRADLVAANLAELAERIGRATPEDGAIELQPGVHCYRKSQTGERVHSVCEPSFCVMAQGSKVILLGDETYRYDPAHYLITTMELPVTGEVVEATRERPYLGFRLTLDPAIVTSVMVESGCVEPRGDGSVKALDVSSLDPEPRSRAVGSPRDGVSPADRRAGESPASFGDVWGAGPSDGAGGGSDSPEL
jgi:hypothetical protein